MRLLEKGEVKSVYDFMKRADESLNTDYFVQCINCEHVLNRIFKFHTAEAVVEEEEPEKLEDMLETLKAYIAKNPTELTLDEVLRRAPAGSAIYNTLHHLAFMFFIQDNPESK